MRKLLCLSVLIIFSGSLSAQNRNARTASAAITVFEGKPATLRLAPHVTTTIRLPEPVNSVVIGDSNLFQAEYSPNEPLLVFARSVTSNPVESNLVISTTRGRQFVFVLRNVGVPADEGEAGVDLLVTCRASGGFFVVIDPRTAEVMVRGGEFFPERKLAHVSGASLGYSFLKLYGIYVGFKLELRVDGRRIITSPVRAVTVLKGDESTEDLAWTGTDNS